MFSPGIKMKKNKRSGEKTNFSRIFLITIVLFFIGTLVGCNKSNTVETDEITAKVAGRILDKIDTEGFTVRLIRLSASGNTEIVSLEKAFTNSEGKFILETNLDGESNLLVQANKDSREWRGVLAADVKPGIAVYIQPLNTVTNISADLYENAVKTEKDLQYTQIRFFIDERIAGMLDSNKELMNSVVNAVAAENDAEKETMLRIEIGGTTSQWQQIIVAKNAAQTALDRDLYFALSESAKQAALYNYLCSVSDAYVDVGLHSDTFSKVLEASIRTFLKEIDGINSPLEFGFFKRTSEIRARVLNAAVLSEFQKLGADPSITNKVIYAGENLQENLQQMLTTEDIADEFVEYRDMNLESLSKIPGISGQTIQAVQDEIDTYKSLLLSDVENSLSRDDIISAYMNFYERINNLVDQQLTAGTIEKKATAEVLILLNMYF